MNNEITGRIFALTGVIYGEVRKRIEQAGGIIVSRVDRGVDALVAGEHGGSKVAVALNLGIPVWDTTRLDAALRGAL